MRKILFIILSIGFLITLSSNKCEENLKDKNNNDSILIEQTISNEKESNWKFLIQAIINCESEGKVNAISRDGKSCGIMQITPICVKDCNKILGNKKYKLQDRFNKNKSLEMFDIIQNNYNPKRDIEKAIRLWNGGSNYSKAKTNSYYKKIMREYNKLKKGKN